MRNCNLDIPKEKIAAFCRKWRVTEFALFGSVLREDFRPDSDVDVMVRFAEDARWGLFDLAAMENELMTMFGRPVDLVTRDSVERGGNYIRRRHILDHMEVLHAG